MCLHTTGTHTVVGKSVLLSPSAAELAVAGGVSTAPLYAAQGLPTRITVLSSSDKTQVMSSSSSTGGCAIKAVKVEHTEVGGGLACVRAFAR